MTFTKIHVVISLIGILTGLVVLIGLISGRRLNGWTAWFLVTTAATNATGFFFPFHGITPAIIVAISSLLVLAIAIFARYFRRFVGAWRWIYVVTAMTALYLNVFVLIVQLFQKVPSLKVLAPTQTEPPFLVAQLFTLLIFILLTLAAAIRFRSEYLRVA
jgi:hypothetical protein